MEALSATVIAITMLIKMSNPNSSIETWMLIYLINYKERNKIHKFIINKSKCKNSCVGMDNIMNLLVKAGIIQKIKIENGVAEKYLIPKNLDEITIYDMFIAMGGNDNDIDPEKLKGVTLSTVDTMSNVQSGFRFE